MRIVLDLQACQTFPEHDAARYALALAREVACRAVVVTVNKRLLTGVDAVRGAFEEVLPAEQIVAFSVPRAPWGTDSTDRARRAAAHDVRLAFLEGLAPDVVHVFSPFSGLDDAGVSSFGRRPLRFSSSATLTDLDVHAGEAARRAGASLALRVPTRGSGCRSAPCDVRPRTRLRPDCAQASTSASW